MHACVRACGCLKKLIIKRGIANGRQMHYTACIEGINLQAKKTPPLARSEIMGRCRDAVKPWRRKKPQKSGN